MGRPRGFTSLKVGRNMVNQWTEIGIPPESRLLALHFEPVSGQFLAQLETPGDSGVKALFARRFDDKAYRRLTPDEVRVSYESIIVRPESTKILANVFRVRPGHSSEWHSIREIDVETGEMTTVLASEKLDVLTGLRGSQLTIPGAGTLTLNASEAPRDLIESCRRAAQQLAPARQPNSE